MNYQWDKIKAVKNLKKHGVDFASAIQVLEDDYALTIDDSSSEGEFRFITLGLSDDGCLVVVWTERDIDIIRIISARKATSHEKKRYLKELP